MAGVEVRMFIDLIALRSSTPYWEYRIIDTEFKEVVWAKDVLDAFFMVYENRVDNFLAYLVKFISWWNSRAYDTDFLKQCMRWDESGKFGDWVGRISKYRNEIDKYWILM